MKYQHKLVNNVVVISIMEEEILSIPSDDVIATVNDEIEKGNTSFIIDLKKVKYVNSTGINFLIAVLTVIRNSEGELVLSSISEKIKNLLIITKLNSIFNVRNTVDESIAFFAENSIVDFN